MARILVVDDDDSSRVFLRRLLADAGYATELCVDGQAGWEQWHAGAEQAKDFDLVITDLCMPRINGLQLIALIEQAAPGTPIILLTGLPPSGFKETLTRILLTKPVEIHTILNCIRALLSRSRTPPRPSTPPPNPATPPA